MKRLGRYLLAEILPLLFTGLLVIILLLLLGALQDVIAPLLAKGARPALVVRLLALQLPEALGRGLPIALLFATLLGLSRLSSDSEIKALYAGGVPPARLFGPVLALGVVVSLLAFAVSEGLVPRSKVKAQSVQRELVLDNPRVAGLESSQGLVLRDAGGRAISIARIEGHQLYGLSVITLQGGGMPREIITAKRGRLREGSNVLELLDGQRISYQNSERPATVLHFERGTLPVQDLQASFGAGGDLKPIYLPLRELEAKVAAYRLQNVHAPQEETALQRKFAEPLAALCMAFFALSLALYSFRSNLNVGLVWVLLLTFLYYATWSVFRVMGEQGALPAWVAAWAPNALYVLAGAALLALAARR